VNPSANAPAADWRGITPGLILTIGCIMAGLFVVDRFLARMEYNEIRSEARRLADDGKRLLAENRGKDAAFRYQRAHSLVRDDPEYALGYAQALLTAGDLERAESTLRDMLNRRSNDARANLLMARVLIARQRPEGADSYYHRAIYGLWPSDAATNQTRVRMELAEWLAQRHSNDELIAELLILQTAAQHDPNMIRRSAELFVAAGSASRAADQYEALIAENPHDVAAYKGLGAAELQRGNDRAAQRALQKALEQDPSDNEVKRRIEMIRAVTELDPTPRRLASREKYNRSMRLVSLASEALRACRTPESGAGETLLKEADQFKAKRVKGPITNELSESRLKLAEDLWSTRLTACTSSPSKDDPLSWVMNRLKAQ
jgi:tetratricopeptide (TPR) repeat protein